MPLCICYLLSGVVEVHDGEPSKNPNRLIIGSEPGQVKPGSEDQTAGIAPDMDDLTSYPPLVRVLSSAALRRLRVSFLRDRDA